MDSSTQHIIEVESGSDDAFHRAARTEPEPLKSRYVSRDTVAVGEGVRFRLKSLDVVPDRFNEGNKVVELTGEILENRAAGLVDEGNVVVSCRSIRLEQMANEIAAGHEVPGCVVTLVRGEDEGKAVGWRWTIEDPPS